VHARVDVEFCGAMFTVRVPVTEEFPPEVNPPVPIDTGPDGFVNVNGVASLFDIANILFAVILKS